MLEIDRSASAELAAAPARCLELLAAVERYPDWASLIAAADVLERGPGGHAARVALRARLYGFEVPMTCALELADAGALLRRLPNEPGDPERYEASWAVAPVPAGSRVSLRVAAAIDAPGPASMLSRRVARLLVDDLLADFERYVSG